MKKETVIFPNQNQLILLTDFQKKVLKASADFSSEKNICTPVFPVCLRSDCFTKIQSFTEKVKKIILDNFSYSNQKIFITATIFMESSEEKGTIDLCRFENDLSPEINFKFLEDLKKELNTQKSNIKKLSPFKIVNLESEEHRNGIEWKVISEKWIKLR